MKINNEILKELFQGYSASKKTYSRKNCPSPMAMASSFKPTASSRKKGGIVDHTTEGSFCREEFMLLFRLQGYDFIPKKLAGKMEHEDSRSEERRVGKECRSRW